MLYSQHACNSLDTDQLTDKDIKLLSMYMLLFVDDIVLFTTDHVSLQAHRTPCMNIELSGVLRIMLSKLSYVFLKREWLKETSKFT